MPTATAPAAGPVLITGAAGFIGSTLAEALLARGTDVVGLDSFDPYYDRRLKERNLAEVRATADRLAARFEFQEGDICDGPGLDALLARTGARGIVHLAAKAGVRPSIADPVGYSRANLLGTSTVLDSAHRAGVERLVVASSSSVYGNNAKTPFSEDDPVERPISPYASTKRACELLCSTHHHLTRTPTCCLRFFTVFGPRQRPDLAISLFLTRIARSEPITVFGDGSMSRDFTYINDIVSGVIAALDRVPAFGYRVWNLGHNHPVRLSELIETCARVAGREPIIERREPSPGDVERTWADLTRSRAELGYEPTTSFEDGVRAQHAWLKACGTI